MPSVDPGSVGHTRRVFLGTGALVVAGAVFGGCGSPAVEGQVDVDRFAALSRVLTGVRELPLDHAGAYLDALDTAGLGMTASELTRAAGYATGQGPSTIDGLMRSPVLRRPGAETCARAIAGAWWSGQVTDAAKRTTLITYDDALVFRAMPYAVPQAQCLGATGVWSQLHPATGSA